MAVLTQRIVGLVSREELALVRVRVRARVRVRVRARFRVRFGLELGVRVRVRVEFLWPTAIGSETPLCMNIYEYI